jgi:hypothetical protein
MPLRGDRVVGTRKRLRGLRSAVTGQGTQWPDRRSWPGPSRSWLGGARDRALVGCAEVSVGTALRAVFGIIDRVSFGGGF